MVYPPPPWTLRGHAVAVLRSLDTAAARALVPPGLDVVSLWPGKTLAGLYVAAYGEGSTLAYGELIVVAGLVREGARVGCWISHIYVDDPRSVAGGREVWGLPKELASFDWRPGGVTVRRSNEALCALRWEQRRRHVPLPLGLPAFGQRDGRVLRFAGRGAMRAGIARVRADVPAGSPFGGLGLEGEGRGVVVPRLRMRVAAPRSR